MPAVLQGRKDLNFSRYHPDSLHCKNEVSLSQQPDLFDNGS